MTHISHYFCKWKQSSISHFIRLTLTSSIDIVFTLCQTWAWCVLIKVLTAVILVGTVYYPSWQMKKLRHRFTEVTCWNQAAYIQLQLCVKNPTIHLSSLVVLFLLLFHRWKFMILICILRMTSEFSTLLLNILMFGLRWPLHTRSADFC